MKKRVFIAGLFLLISSFFIGKTLAQDSSFESLVQEVKQIVDYHFNSTEGQSIVIKVDYGADGTIWNVSFHLNEQKADGKYSYEIISNEGKALNLEFEYKDNDLFNVRLDTPFRPLPENRGEVTVLTLLSLDGKEVLVSFTWNDDGSVKNVNVKPREEFKSWMCKIFIFSIT